MKQKKEVEVAEEEEEIKEVKEDDVKEEKHAVTYPLEVIYCKCNINNQYNDNSIVCTTPPEYCTYMNKDSSQCKEWLKVSEPELYQELYAEEDKKKEEAKAEGETDDKGQPQK